MLEDSYSRRVREWLKRFGFQDDPFVVCEADRERSYLHLLFVDRPYLFGVLGHPLRPQTAFLMAGRGNGKSATREMVAYECEHGRFRRKALAVRYYDFTRLLDQVEGDLSRITAHHHVRAIVRATLQALADTVAETFYDYLDVSERTLLLAYMSEYASPVVRIKLGRILTGAPSALPWADMMAVEILETLVEILVKLGQSSKEHYEALYVLVDRVDETAFGPEGAVSLLKPLVAENALLGMQRVAFKFFLPLEVGDQLQQTVPLRRDRVYFDTITWDAQALQRMIEERLAYHSQGNVEHMEQLFTPTVRGNALRLLIQRSNGSPRTLLRLCEALLHNHVRRSDETLLDARDVTGALAEFDHEFELEQKFAARPRVDAVRSAAEPPAQGLFLEDTGHVWVDGQPLATPLTELEFRLLRLLYRATPDIVSKEALIEAVWSDPSLVTNESTRVMDEQNLRKLIGRLRERLEPGLVNGRSRFVRNVRGRGYWLSIC